MFKDFEFEWDGVKHKVPSNKILKLICALEKEACNRFQLCLLLSRGGVPAGHLATAYSVMLNYIGVTADEGAIYRELNLKPEQALVKVDELLRLFEPPDNVVPKETDKGAES